MAKWQINGARWPLLVGAAVLATPLAAQAAHPADVFYERAVMSAADARCRLFDPEMGAALAASTAQARGAALRSGSTSDVLASVRRAAYAKAAQTPCDSPDIATAANRVRQAFANFAHMARLTYPGDVAPWKADRNISPGPARWRLIQETSFGADRLQFGLVGRSGPGFLMAVARFADGGQPYAARLLIRDTSRSSQPYLERWTNGSTAGLPLQRRVPPRDTLIAYPAVARSQAGTDLLPKDVKSGWAFRFSDAAAQALAQLDPREAILVEFLFPNDTSRQAYVEIGDFAAGRAFLTVAAP